MEIQYKKLTEKELDTFIQMRINQLKEEGATEEIDLVPALRDYYDRHMSDGTFVSWLAKDGEKIVGTVFHYNPDTKKVMSNLIQKNFTYNSNRTKQLEKKH